MKIQFIRQGFEVHLIGRQAICENCGQVYVSARKGSCTCGPRCRQARARAKRKGTFAKHLACHNGQAWAGGQ